MSREREQAAAAGEVCVGQGKAVVLFAPILPSTPPPVW